MTVFKGRINCSAQNPKLPVQSHGLRPSRRGSIVRMRKSKPASASQGKPAKSAQPASAPIIDDYLAAVPEPGHDLLVNMRTLIRSALPPEATEVISYRMPAFKLKKVLVWYAAFSDHCSLFPTAAVIDLFKDQLKGYKTAKGTIQFPMDKPLPAALIRKVVKARLAQSEIVTPRKVASTRTARKAGKRS